MSSTASSTLTTVAKGLWGATLVALPVTSFRYFPAGEGTLVRPLAFFPLAALLLVQAVRLARREVGWPSAAVLTPLLAFLLAALAFSLLGILYAPVPIRGQEVLSRILRAWVTIIMGVGFFLGAIWMNSSEADVRFSMRWLFVGLTVNILWSGVQAATFYFDLLPKSMVTQWQRVFSLRELIRTNRVSGMAYEPSWLAGQITTIYLPWLLAAVLIRVRVTRWPWLEPCLLVAAGSLVLATFSRGGILTMLLSVGLTLLLVGGREIRASWNWFASGLRRPGSAAARLAILVTAAAILAGAAWFLGQKGYISRLWEGDALEASDVSDLLIKNSAGARGAYLVSAFRTYEEHPWTGVGLGASGFYMYSRFPDWALTTVPEIARQLSPESSLYPNPKNLYVRLLAEVGILGLLLYLAFQLTLLGTALEILRAGGAFPRFLGIAAVGTWLALLLYNTTQTFATPNLWVNFEIVAGMAGAILPKRMRDEAN